MLYYRSIYQLDSIPLYSSRLHAQRLQPNNPSFFPIHTNYIILRPGPINLYLEHLDLSISCLLHRVDDLLILAVETFGLVFLYIFVAAEQLLQVICSDVSCAIQISNDSSSAYLQILSFRRTSAKQAQMAHRHR
jgi:hypothetical protein